MPIYTNVRLERIDVERGRDGPVLIDNGSQVIAMPGRSLPLVVGLDDMFEKRVVGFEHEHFMKSELKKRLDNPRREVSRIIWKEARCYIAQPLHEEHFRSHFFSGGDIHTTIFANPIGIGTADEATDFRDVNGLVSPTDKKKRGRPKSLRAYAVGPNGEAQYRSLRSFFRLLQDPAVEKRVKSNPQDGPGGLKSV